MTVQELINLLQQEDKNLEVYVQDIGDSEGEVYSIEGYVVMDNEIFHDKSSFKYYKHGIIFGTFDTI